MFIAAQKVELNHVCYTILDGMHDPLSATSPMHQAAGKPEYYSDVKVKELYSALAEILLIEKQLKNEKKRAILNPLFNHSESVRDRETVLL